MSAPRAILLTLLLLVTGVVAGCTVPGAGHLDRPPKQLSPAMDFIPGDAIAYTIVDTRPTSPRWMALRRFTKGPHGNRALVAQLTPLFGDTPIDLDLVTPWIGNHTGTVLRVFDVNGRNAGARLTYADVRNRAVAEQLLTRIGFREHPKRHLGDGIGERLTLWTFQGRGGRALQAVGISDKVLVGARTTAGLRQLVRAADEYAMPNRAAMADYTVEAQRRTPFAVVFRTDVARLQVRRLVQDDPALLEFARWPTASDTVLAVRDGWLGIAPPTNPKRNAVRVVGAFDWISDLAPDVHLQPVKRAHLDLLPASTSTGVAVHDPGQFGTDLLSAISSGGIQFATTEDVPEGMPRVKLLELLEDLDGDSAIGWNASRGTLNASVSSSASDVTPRVGDALALADLDGTATKSENGVAIEVQLPQRGMRHAAVQRGQLADVQGYTAGFAAAGRPPRTPVLWMWHAGNACTGPIAGWVTFDGVARLTISADVELGRSAAACQLPVSATAFGFPLPG